MNIYVGSAGNKHLKEELAKHERVRVIMTPFDLRLNIDCRFALDNGAFTAYMKKEEFCSKAFLDALVEIKERCDNPDFCVIPDIVGAGYQSLRFSENWRSMLPDRYNWYLAVQDGMSIEMIEQTDMKYDGIFVGGTKKWKYDTAKAWVRYAHHKKMNCHIGRIGTKKGILWAHNIGADSIDSSNFAQHIKNWNELLEYLKTYKEVLHHG